MAQIHENVDAAAQKNDPHAQRDQEVRDSLNKIKHKLMVMSGKGGVGKTSTSVNLAIALAKQGHKVGIMDVDLHGPDVPRMLGMQKELLEMNDANKLKPMQYNERLGAVSVESLTMEKDSAIIWRGPIKYSAIQQFISQVEWGELDYLIIDAPPGTGDEPLTVAQTIPEAKAVIVTTPQEVSLADVRKSINFCKTVKMGVVGLIENMSGLVCPHCNEQIDLFGAGGGENLAQSFKLTFLGRIPLDPQLVACGDAGVSFQEKYPQAQVTKAYESIAQRIGKMG